MKRFIFVALFLATSPQCSWCQQVGGFDYAVRFVCGKTDGAGVVPGSYYTAINFHNPNEKPVVFKKKVAIALPTEKAALVTNLFEAKLGSDQAFEIDCPDILRTFFH